MEGALKAECLAPCTVAIGRWSLALGECVILGSSEQDGSLCTRMECTVRVSVTEDETCVIVYVCVVCGVCPAGGSGPIVLARICLRLRRERY